MIIRSLTMLALLMLLVWLTVPSGSRGSGEEGEQMKRVKRNILSAADNPGTWVYVYSTPAALMQFKTWPELGLAAWRRVL